MHIKSKQDKGTRIKEIGNLDKGMYHEALAQTPNQNNFIL